MSSYFELTAEQLAFWKAEGHNTGKPSLAIIYANGAVEMDYPDEIRMKFKALEDNDFMCNHIGLQEGDSCQNCGCTLKMVKEAV